VPTPGASRRGLTPFAGRAPSSRLASWLNESECVAVRIGHVELTRAPGLIERAFVDGRRRIAGRSEPPTLKRAKQSVRVIGEDDHGLPELPVARMARQEEDIGVTPQRDKGRIVTLARVVLALEVEDRGVERHGRRDVATSNQWDNRHRSTTKPDLRIGERRSGG